MRPAVHVNGLRTSIQPAMASPASLSNTLAARHGACRPRRVPTCGRGITQAQRLRRRPRLDADVPGSGVVRPSQGPRTRCSIPARRPDRVPDARPRGRCGWRGTGVVQAGSTRLPTRCRAVRRCRGCSCASSRKINSSPSTTEPRADSSRRGPAWSSLIRLHCPRRADRREPLEASWKRRSQRHTELLRGRRTRSTGVARAGNSALTAIDGAERRAARCASVPGRGRRLPVMGALTLPIGKTSTCPALPRSALT